MTILIVAAGGGLGAVARYATVLLIRSLFPSQRLPYATLTVNLLGSFALGIFFAMLFGEVQGTLSTEASFLFFAVGFFGAYTTFSTFSVDTVQIFSQGRTKDSLIYVTVSTAGSIASFFAGISLIQ
ncbi:fluoride efflux transporter CrcB [Salisediminibacterium halotolerans]|uniref:Fluoride-specific ion channel FluC n=1 Tax=Salisediminibacterium halotolerans TaxID=517425 RepID=A0A1H9SNM0_9BACI|nr:fluoride efflux transporter CrcB [Salisediminibacterium haloalkalitolerans]SER85973.1 CrcB protein [Salisediminibacterium haloalkalitolerans]